MTNPITPPPPHLLKKFSAQAQDEANKRNGTGYLKTVATLCIEWFVNSQSTSNDRQIRSSEIEPPPELLVEWASQATKAAKRSADVTVSLATQAAQWGADRELEACCEWFICDWTDIETADKLRAARRPKQPSLVKRAIHILGTHGDLSCAEHDTIRRALEALDD